MIHNPPHPNPDLPNRHTAAIGLTGSGKSQVIKQLVLPPSGVRTVLFDPSRDHRAGTHYYSSRSAFARALAAANASGRGFRVAYDGVRSPEIYEWWCECCIAVLDGRKVTYMMTEELAAVSRGPGKALPAHQWLMNESRKYGGVYLCTTQFPAQISKAVYDNSGCVYLGKQPPRLQRQFSDQFGIPLDDLKGLQDLEFMRWTAGKVDRVKLQYKKS